MTESTIGRIKDEYILDKEFTDFQHAYQHLCYVLDWAYNHQRPHSSLSYLTPAEFEAQYHQRKTSLENGVNDKINAVKAWYGD